MCRKSSLKNTTAFEGGRIRLIVGNDYLDPEAPLLGGSVANARTVRRTNHPVAVIGTRGHWRGHVRDGKIDRFSGQNFPGNVAAFAGAEGIAAYYHEVIIAGPLASTGVFYGPGFRKFGSRFHDRAGRGVYIAKEGKLEAFCARLICRGLRGRLSRFC